MLIESDQFLCVRRLSIFASAGSRARPPSDAAADRAAASGGFSLTRLMRSSRPPPALSAVLEYLLRHAFRQVHEAVVFANIHAADMHALDARLVGDGTDDVSRLDAMYRPDLDAKSFHYCAGRGLAADGSTVLARSHPRSALRLAADLSVARGSSIRGALA